MSQFRAIITLERIVNLGDHGEREVVYTVSANEDVLITGPEPGTMEAAVMLRITGRAYALMASLIQDGKP